MLLFIAPLLKFFSGSASKYLMYAMVAVTLIGALWYLDPYRAKLATAQAQIAQDASNAAALAARNAIIQKQLTGELATAQAEAIHYATIRKAISDAPHTSTCGSSPSFRAALDGLRNATPAGAPAH